MMVSDRRVDRFTSEIARQTGRPAVCSRTGRRSLSRHSLTRLTEKALFVQPGL